MRLGVCAGYQEVAALETIPFDYLEEGVQRFLMPERPQEEFERALRGAQELSVPVEAANAMLPADLVLIETASQRVDAARLERYVRTAVARAEQAGIRLIVFGSGAARRCPPDGSIEEATRQVGEQLARWSGWASECGVTFALEPLGRGETNVLNTVAEAAILIEALDLPNARLLADTYHMACNGEAARSLVAAVPLLAHVHVAELRERAAPGRHGEDFRSYLAPLRGGGYDGRISIECDWQDFAAEVAPAVATLRAQWG